MHLLFASAEIYPYAKTGGLADISASLPKALGNYMEVLSVMPMYDFIDKKKYDIIYKESFDIEIEDKRYPISLFYIKDSNILFVYNKILSSVNSPYGDEGIDYTNNHIRFAIFCYAVAYIAIKKRIDILHCNDWHTALIPYIIKKYYNSSILTLLTIHNLAYQGIFLPYTLELTGIKREDFTIDKFEFYNKVNWLKGGIYYANAITTVSPSYAKEILTPKFGCGLNAHLQFHKHKLRGILNGIDYEVYNPFTDRYIASNYNYKHIAGKKECKDELVFKYQLDLDVPLYIFIGRFVEQKGVSLLLSLIEHLKLMPASLIVLGDGNKIYNKYFKEATKDSKNVKIIFGYDDTLSHKLYAAADFLLMPSTFEPCGLNQMIAMRYATIPIVHRVGGLKDSVYDINSGKWKCGLGYSVADYDVSMFVQSIEESYRLWSNKEEFDTICRFDMLCDFSIGRCAKEYYSLYKSMKEVI